MPSRHAIKTLFLPVFKLRIASAKGKDGVGQRPAIAAARMDSDQNHPVSTAFHVAGVKFSSIHGVNQVWGTKISRRHCAQNRYKILGQFFEPCVSAFREPLHRTPPPTAGKARIISRTSLDKKVFAVPFSARRHDGPCCCRCKPPCRQPLNKKRHPTTTAFYPVK